MNDSIRDKIGQVINDELFKLDNIKDYCDSREIDRIADAVLAALCIPTDAPADITVKPLRDLRMWHWREAMKARPLQREHEGKVARFICHGMSPTGHIVKKHAREAKRYEKVADRHIKAVQALNDVVPGTAERDCADDPQ